jgi:16S rRNA processing protein RimM
VGRQSAPARIVVGRIAGVYGVRGWVKVLSDTDPREGILDYQPWLLGQEARVWNVEEAKRHGRGLIVHLQGCDDRDLAATLVGQAISVRRDQLPPPAEDELYWIDLEGLEVVTSEGTRLGVIDHLFSTGVNDVMVIRGERERLLPFAWDQVVKHVDLEQRRMVVDWDPSF